MSDERSGMPELSRIVSLIMENPQLVAQIAQLAKESPESEDVKEPEEPKTESVSTSLPVHTVNRRAALLSAMKPFLSQSRAGAIDSMLTFGEVLDIMKSGRQGG